MIEFITEYWLNFIFGAIALGISAFAKKKHSDYKKMEETYKAKQKDEFLEEVNKKIDKVKENSDQKDEGINKKLDDVLNAIAVIQTGLISVQYDRINQLCMFCLKKKKISERDFHNLQQMMETYRLNHGNHGMEEVYEMTIKLPIVPHYDEEN